MHVVRWCCSSVSYVVYEWSQEVVHGVVNAGLLLHLVSWAGIPWPQQPASLENDNQTTNAAERTRCSRSWDLQTQRAVPNPVSQIAYPFVLCPEEPGKRHLERLHVGVVKEAALTTHRFLHTERNVNGACHNRARGGNLRWNRWWATYGFSFQIVVQFLHVCIRMSVHRMSMDVISKARVREEQHWNLTRH